MLYPPDIRDKICTAIAKGESLRSICRKDDMPALGTVFAWRRNSPEFDAAFLAARVASGQPAHRISNSVRWKYYNDVVLPYQGDECLIWPYSRKGSRGYAAIWETKVGHKNSIVHYISRLVCEAVHGAPPSDSHEAAHLCGRGKFGCVAAKHLAWKTVQENNWDKDLHGTRIWGERHPDAKLTVEQILEIRSRADTGEKQQDLATEFGVGKSTMSSIVRRKTWRRLA